MAARVRAALTTFRALPVLLVVRLLLRAAPGRTLLLTALVMIGAALPLGWMLAVGELTRAAARLLGPDAGALPHPGSLGPVGPALVLLVFALVGQELVAGALDLLSENVSRLFARVTTGQVLDGTLRTIGIADVENPATADRVSLAGGFAPGTLPPGRIVPALAHLAEIRLGAVLTAVLLARTVWWAPVPLALAWMVTGRWLDREVRGAVRGFNAATPSLRRAGHLRDLLMSPAGAREVRVFGLQRWILDRYAAEWWAGMREVLSYRQPPRALVARAVLLVGTHVVVLGWLAHEASGPALDVGGLAVAVQAVMAMPRFGYAGDDQWAVANCAAAVKAVEEVRALSSADVARGGSAPAVSPGHSLALARAAYPSPRPPGIVLHDVTFGYPGAARPVLAGVDLAVPPGSSLALVGANGAGKTTLLKLLGLLERPMAGRIEVDGTDLGSLDPIAWRRRLAVVFQDFCRYPLSLRDNLRFGAVHADLTDDDLLDALDLAGGTAVLKRLPDGLDTVLSREFTGGTELSGGQWQRVALARALVAVRGGAHVLVLDEPTAHLDVSAEARLYERFLELTAGSTTILVSHRFGTVRLAERICVLEGGRITEAGSHEDLLATGGAYARRFTRQAGTFSDDVTAGFALPTGGLRA